MAKIVEVVASRTVKINLGDFQSSDLFLSMKAECAEGDKSGEVAAFLTKKVDGALFIRLKQVMAKRGKAIPDDKLRKLYGFPE